MKLGDTQDSARETWDWLWHWIKQNRKREYREKYIQDLLVKRIGCKAPALSLWKKGKMNFEEKKLQKVFDILDEWAAMLPKEGWRHLPGRVWRLYIDDTKDKEGKDIKVCRVLDYREQADLNSYVQCDHKCKHCQKITPSKGERCMYCGEKIPRPKELK